MLSDCLQVNELQKHEQTAHTAGSWSRHKSRELSETEERQGIDPHVAQLRASRPPRLLEML